MKYKANSIDILGLIKLIGLRINRNIATKLMQIISSKTDRDNEVAVVIYCRALTKQYKHEI